MTKTITQDMTKGSSTKVILQFSLPMLIGNLFQQLYNMVDSIVVGRFVDRYALAAVGATGSAIFLLHGIVFGLSAGISVVISQYFGAKDYDKVRKGFATAAYIVIGVAILTGVLGFFSSRWLLQLLGTPDTIIGQADVYMKICYAGILGAACYNGMSGILRALGDSVTPLVFLVVASLLNVGLDLLFVIVFHWGVAGTAIATVISQFVSAAGCILYAFVRVKMLRMPFREFRPDKIIFLKCIQMGIPAALQNSFISVSMVVLQGVVNSYQDIIIAANTAVSRMEQLILQPGMSVGAALAAFAGQNIGAGQKKRAKQGFRSATWIILAFSIIMIPVMYFGSGLIMKLFTKKEDIAVLHEGIQAIHITCFFYPFVGMIFVTRSFLSGVGDINLPMIMGFTEVVCRISLVYLLTSQIGYTGIWWATGINWLLTSLVGIFRIVSGKWENKAIIHDL